MFPNYNLIFQRIILCSWRPVDWIGAEICRLYSVVYSHIILWTKNARAYNCHCDRKIKEENYFAHLLIILRPLIYFISLHFIRMVTFSTEHYFQENYAQGLMSACSNAEVFFRSKRKPSFDTFVHSSLAFILAAWIVECCLQESWALWYWKLLHLFYWSPLPVCIVSCYMKTI